MMKKICLSLIIVFSLFMSASANSKEPQTVILLHGIGHTKWNMYFVEHALKKEGYETLNISYPSLSKGIDALSDFIHERLEMAEIWDKNHKINFVTHSMGGIVTSHYLNKYEDSIEKEYVGRVVMIAPPNKGSEIADLLKDFTPYKKLFGPAGQELTTSHREKNIKKPYYEVGVIAGTRGWPYMLGNVSIKGAHDGRVALERTKMEGMRDHVALPATHSFIAWKPSVHQQIIRFLENGSFKRAATK
jgi:pimeloyl-ACP methyl ester carboxylesterase